MFPKIDPTTTLAWQQLKAEYAIMRKSNLKDFFLDDGGRFNKFSISAPDILVDFSKNIISETTLLSLLKLAEDCGLPAAIKAMFNGEVINETEGRAVLHTALRNFSGKPVIVDGLDVMPQVNAEQVHMKDFCKRIHSGEWKGFTAKKISTIVNIGIGGSDLGPVMVTESLKPYW
ncbi:MAG: glucose-6-phosphate isomerase, partial [Chitinophagaceae bacterium]